MPDNHFIQETTMRSRGTPLFQDGGVAEEDMARINELAPSPLKPEQVYARSMFLCSTQPCDSDGCRFTRTALESVARLIIGQSVLCGHNRNSLPLARFYKANVVERGAGDEGEPLYFVRAWFYWLRETSGAKDLLLNIDGGIYREVSLAWKYDSWRCSICQAENGRCGHLPGSLYDGKKCYRLIDGLVDVLEGSLVYKSADRHTYLTGVHAERGEQETPPLLLICRHDDPMLAYLESIGAVSDKQELDEKETSLQEGADHLWARCSCADDVHRCAHRFLADRGICLGEILPCGGNDSAMAGSTVGIMRRGGVVGEIDLCGGRENGDAQLR